MYQTTKQNRGDKTNEFLLVIFNTMILNGFSFSFYNFNSLIMAHSHNDSNLNDDNPQCRHHLTINTPNVKCLRPPQRLAPPFLIAWVV
jgi:hypothetical protein